MIPNSPQWSTIKEKAIYKNTMLFPAPPAGALVSDISLGPSANAGSEGGLKEGYWLVYQEENNDVSLYVYIKGSWVGVSVLFAEPEKIKDISLSFDQLGRPTVFYRVNEYDLKLYSFNPSSLKNEVELIGIGESILSSLDDVDNPGSGYSDILLFYVRNDIAYMRVQREKFKVEHEAPLTGKDLSLVSSGMRVDNRYQVIYRYEDDTYIPPPPKPPVPPGFNGDYIYMQASVTQFGLEKPLINSVQHDDISIAFNIYGVNELLETLDPKWGAYGIPIFCEGGTTTLYPIPLRYNKSIYFDIRSPQYGYFRNSARDTQLKVSRKFSLAFMYLDNALYLTLVMNGKKYAPIMPFNLSDGRWTVAITGNTLTVLNDATTLFTMEVERGQDGDDEPEPGRFGAYSLGALHNMWRQNFRGALYGITVNIAGTQTHYPLMTQNSPTQESNPPGNNITIYNHKPVNWKYMLA